MEEPKPPHGFARAELLALLCRCEQYPLTLLLAPAGSGKSTLLAHWQAGRPRSSVVHYPLHGLATGHLDDGGGALRIRIDETGQQGHLLIGGRRGQVAGGAAGRAEQAGQLFDGEGLLFARGIARFDGRFAAQQAQQIDALPGQAQADSHHRQQAQAGDAMTAQPGEKAGACRAQGNVPPMSFLFVQALPGPHRPGPQSALLRGSKASPQVMMPPCTILFTYRHIIPDCRKRDSCRNIAETTGYHRHHMRAVQQ